LDVISDTDWTRVRLLPTWLCEQYAEECGRWHEYVCLSGTRTASAKNCLPMESQYKQVNKLICSAVGALRISIVPSVEYQAEISIIVRLDRLRRCEDQEK